MNNNPFIPIKFPKPKLPVKFGLDQWVLHLKTQRKYQIISLPDDNLIKTEEGWKPAYGYCNECGGPKFYRAQCSMEDGRFVVTDPPTNNYDAISNWNMS